MEKSSISSALLEFQKKRIKISKGAVNPHFKSKYADLPSIIEAITPALNEIGLTVTHSVANSELVTSIRIGSESIESRFPLFGTKPQEFGSSITYARRYNLGALLNLDIDDDDDGNVANTAPRTQYAKDEGSPFLDLINEIKKCDDLAELKEKYEQAKNLAKSDKMKKWLNDEATKAKERINDAEQDG